MIVIPLKSQYVSLIITFISGASELVLLSSTLQWNSFFGNKRFQRGRKVNVRNHLARTKLLALVTTFVFLAIEIVNSFYSDPTTIDRLETRPCNFLARADFGENATNAPFEFNPISLSCLEANDTTIWQRGGNQFEIEGDFAFQCSGTLFSFDRQTDENPLVPNNYVVECVPAPQLLVDLEHPEACSLVYRRGNRVTFSDFFRRGGQSAFLEQSQPVFWHTDVMFDVAGRETEIASRAAFHLSHGEGDDVDLRRKIFTRDGERLCDFRREIDATSMSLALVCLLLSLWIVCCSSFLLSLLFRSRIVYDIDDPLDWATKMVIDEDVVGADNPEASSVTREGRQFLVLSNSSATSEVVASSVLSRRIGRSE